MDFEGAECVLIVCGDEDDGVIGADEFEDFETIELRHLDVEENEVGVEFIDGFHGLEAVGAFGDDFEVGVGGDEFAKDGAGEFLVVDDDGADFRRGVHESVVLSAGKSMVTRKWLSSRVTAKAARVP